MDIYCKVTPYGLVPLYDSDHELKQRLKTGTTVRCRVTLPRNYEFHKKFFALVRLTFDNLPLPLVERWNVKNENDMLRRFKRDLGYFTSHRNELGDNEIEYLSISFSAMDEATRPTSNGSTTTAWTWCCTSTCAGSGGKSWKRRWHGLNELRIRNCRQKAIGSWIIQD